MEFVSEYKKMTNDEKSQFVSCLIGEGDLLKDMGKWFERNPFLSLFRSEFDKGSREKSLIKLAEINSEHVKMTNNASLMKIFWIPSAHEEHNILFKKIMGSKNYGIKETTCILHYEAINHDNVEVDSTYTLGFNQITYEDAKYMGNVIRGNKGGCDVKIKGFLAEIF